MNGGEDTVASAVETAGRYAVDVPTLQLVFFGFIGAMLGAMLGVLVVSLLKR